MNRVDVYAEIDAERDQQSKKWGGPHQWGEGDCSSRLVDETVKLAVLTEETGEVARALLDDPDDTDGLRRELIQVAAVAVAWLEALP